VDGETTTIGGTSAVAPLWAGLIALANAANAKDAGFVNPTLYAAANAFHDVTSGNNGAFSAGLGWDPCTGLGSPQGAAVIAALAGTNT
jgi:kumamolisin